MVKTYDEALSEVLEFMDKEVPSLFRHERTENTTLKGDLRMDNYDIEVMLLRYFERFHVERGDFNFRKYFPDEGEGIIGAMIMGWRNRKQPKIEPKPMTIGMLARSVVAGVWCD